VVTLRYSDAQGEADAAREPAPQAKRRTEPMESRPEADSEVDEESMRMKGTVARNIARIGPAFERFAQRAKTTIALLAARRSLKGDDAASPRRTTAPAPGGGLHTSGRRVVRGEPEGAQEDVMPKPRLEITKRRAAIAGGVMIAAIIGAIALKKSHHEASAPVATSPATEAAAGNASPISPIPTQAVPALPPVPPIDTGTSLGGGPMLGSGGGMASADEPFESGGKGSHKHHGKAAPFGNGPVHHGNVLHLKMDGPIEAIEGAQQPTGFAVKLPGRKSLEAAGPLASRDSRIAAIKVSNDSAGAELTVAFKDGVPHYLVSAKGDTLNIALAPVGAVDKVAKKDSNGGEGGKHHKHEHKKSEKH
jgi:hypothetical protein